VADEVLAVALVALLVVVISSVGVVLAAAEDQQALARLGYQVTLIPPGDGSPPPSATSQQPAA
jgi:hypothetical protein